MSPSPDLHRGHRFPAEIIAHAVWLDHVFSLSLRDSELLLAERGVIVSYESVRRWCLKFGRSFADKLRRRRPRPGDIWHLDEVFLRINGKQLSLARCRPARRHPRDPCAGSAKMQMPPNVSSSVRCEATVTNHGA